MKKLLLIIIVNYIFLIVNCFSQQYGWIDISTNIPPFPYDTTIINNGQDTLIANLSDVYFINDNEGWITTWHAFDDTAAILHTTDGCETFDVQTTILPCEAIWMRTAQEGYACGENGFIYKTTNGGQNWNFHGTIGNTVTDISFPIAVDTGSISGDWGSIWGITQTGVFNFNCGLASPFTGTSTTSSNHIWTCGRTDIYFTGASGCIDLPAPTGSFFKIQFINDYLGWVAGGTFSVDTGLVAGSPDGINWVVLGFPPASMFGLFALDSNNIWAVGQTVSSEGVIMHTSNGSDFGFDTTTSTGWSNVIWNQEGAGLTTASLIGVYFTSQNNGYVVGSKKTLLKYTQLTSVEEETKLPTEFRLEQNYPNPFNPSTKISWQSPLGSWQTIKIYDVLGNEIVTLVDEYKQAGEYEIEFSVGQSAAADRPAIASGIYFYQLRIGGPEINSGQGIIQTRKMVYIK